MNVLLVEDSKAIIKLVKKLFEKICPEVKLFVAEDVDTAGEFLFVERINFEVIFLDYNLLTVGDGELILEELSNQNMNTLIMLSTSCKDTINLMMEKYQNLNIFPFGKCFNKTNIQLAIYKKILKKKKNQNE